MKSAVKAENNRIFNLIWLVLFGAVFAIVFVYPINQTTLDLLPFFVFALIEILIIILPKRNNFVSAFFLAIIALLVNTISSKFYNLTWLFYPKLDNVIIGSMKYDRLLSALVWYVSFLTLLSFVYMFCSSVVKLFLKKSKCLVCFLISLVLVCLSSYLCFIHLPLSFAFPKEEISRNIDESIEIKFFDEKKRDQEILSVQSAHGFFVNVQNLSKGKRYGLRILNWENQPVENEEEFLYCSENVCSISFNVLNSISNRLNPGVYTVQVISQKGNNLTVIGEKIVEITKLEIVPYEKDKQYPCQMWLTHKDGNEKLLRIEEKDSQKMLDIVVMVQCDGGVYDAEIDVGTINQEVQYYLAVINGSNPVGVLNLGGNTAHGVVRLIVNNQIMGEAIIDRGFPICDNGKIVEGGNQWDCK